MARLSHPAKPMPNLWHPATPMRRSGQWHNIFRCEIRFCMVTKHVCIRRGLIRCTALLYWQGPSTIRDPGCLLCLAVHFSVTSGEICVGSLCLEETCTCTTAELVRSTFGPFLSLAMLCSCFPLQSTRCRWHWHAEPFAPCPTAVSCHSKLSVYFVVIAALV